MPNRPLEPRAALEAAIEALAAGRHGDPFSLLGPHRETAGGRRAIVIRACQPTAREVFVVRPDGGDVDMTRRHRAGVFEAVFFDEREVFDYRLRVTYFDGRSADV